MAIKLNGKKNQEDPITKYRNDKQSLTQRIIENTSHRSSCDPHGQVLYTNSPSSDILTEAATEWLDQSRDDSKTCAQTSASTTQASKLSDCEAALYGAEQEAFASSWQEPAALVPPEGFFMGDPDSKDNSVSGQDMDTLPVSDCLGITEIGAAMPGVKRTQRGTIELVRLPNGKTITPRYNRCGIIVDIKFDDGTRIVKSDGQFPWIVLDAQGQHVEELKIVQLTFDRAGNLIYVTADGERTTFRTDGTVISEHLR